ncbi:MAG: hypothetical protein LBI68_09230 [Azoarcus sp.]|nr:hypothetical protein [Azoarcus sp.]
MKITDDCLFVRPSTGTIHGGYMSMSWWATLISVAMGIATTYVSYAGYSPEMVLGDAGFWVLILMFPVGCFWTYIPWRRQLPIIFNRKIRKVTCYYKGKTYAQDWEALKAYAKGVRSVHYGGFAAKEGILSIFITCRDPQTGEEIYTSQPIYGTYATKNGRNDGVYRAAMIWEYIRLFMREGKEALPPFVFSQEEEPLRPLAKYCPDSLRYVFFSNLPGNPFQAEPLFWPLSIPIHLIALPFSALWMATDLVYLCLDRLLPRRKWPKELLEACDHAWDGSNDHGAF